MLSQENTIKHQPSIQLRQQIIQMTPSEINKERQQIRTEELEYSSIRKATDVNELEDIIQNKEKEI